MTIDEVKTTLNMLISNDIETAKLACGIFETEFPHFMSYELFLREKCGRFVIADLLYEDRYYKFMYSQYLREKICPFIIYSPYQCCFV